MRRQLKDQLIKHEGLAKKVYRCPAGYLTIGIGRNLEAVGITEAEALYLLDNDISRVIKELNLSLPWVLALDSVRLQVVANMCFNLGISRLLGFKKMLAALKISHYEKAADEMVDSKWYNDVGQRAKELVEMMRTGKEYNAL